MGFPGKVAMVTGAGSGIGLATARALAQAGVRVALCDVNRAALDSAATEIARIGITPLTFELDVTDSAHVEAVVGDIARTCGKLDILFNSAGILHQPITLLDMSDGLWDQHWDVNLMGTIFCAQAAAREMLRRQYGRIINVASSRWRPASPQDGPLLRHQSRGEDVYQVLGAGAGEPGRHRECHCPGSDGYAHDPGDSHRLMRPSKRRTEWRCRGTQRHSGSASRRGG